VTDNPRIPRVVGYPLPSLAQEQAEREKEQEEREKEQEKE
tara:strand:+ start:364 stop:483 length:120 start_codon:yes stop_codon:yes gene_type:complete